MYEFSSYKVTEQVLSDLFIRLVEMFNWDVVIQDGETKTIMNSIPYERNYGKYLGELFINNQFNILTNRHSCGNMIKKVSYKQFVDHIKKNKLANKDGIVGNVDELIKLWEE